MLNGIEIGASNAAGEVKLPKTTDNIEIMVHGYESETINTGLENKSIFLLPKTFDKKIREVIIKNKEDVFANLIVKNMNKLFDKNHINNLNSYQQIVYSKILLDEKKKDSSIKDTFKKIDSIKVEVKKEIDTAFDNYVKDNAFFVWERVFNHKHDIHEGEKVVLMSSRMSGLKQPIYEILAEMYKVNKYPTVFNDNRVNQLTFSLEDSLLLNGRMTYYLSFYTKKKFRGKYSISGTFYVDASTFSLVKFTGGNKERYFEYNFNLFNEKFYTDKFYFSGVMNNIQAGNKTVALQFFVNTRDFKSPFTFDSKEFKGNEYEISKDLNSKNSDKIIEMYRVDSLTAREANTFVTLDSIAKKENFENKLRLFLALRSGELKINKINLNVFDLVGYNGYEGLRINLSARTNYNFSSTWVFNGNLAYGIDDKAFKIGGGFSYLTNYEKNSKIGIQVSKDVNPTGRTTHFFEVNRLSINELFYKNYFDNFSIQGFYSTDLNRYIEGKFGIDYIAQKSLTLYQYNSNFSNANYQFISPSFTLSYAPKTKYINTPEGKFEIESKPTKFYLTLNSGIGMNTITPNYQKANLKVKTVLKSLLGTTNISANTGIILGSTPLFNTFEAMGVAPNTLNLISSFGVSSSDGFMTMASGRFYSDRQVSIFIRHSILNKRVLKSFHFNPNIAYSATIGEMSDRIKHSISLESPTKLYQETGLELRKIILGLGIGTYYRFGAYNTGVFKDNIAFRLTFDVPLNL